MGTHRFSIRSLAISAFRRLSSSFCRASAASSSADSRAGVGDGGGGGRLAFLWLLLLRWSGVLCPPIALWLPGRCCRGCDSAKYAMRWLMGEG